MECLILSELIFWIILMCYFLIVQYCCWPHITVHSHMYMSMYVWQMGRISVTGTLSHWLLFIFRFEFNVNGGQGAGGNSQNVRPFRSFLWICILPNTRLGTHACSICFRILFWYYGLVLGDFSETDLLPTIGYAWGSKICRYLFIWFHVVGFGY